ncbi:bacteriohemerythrin [uncultured Methanoregula sp.]|uniref:bacteriohemerythrin n=1 Tax=uncultured Methanoregula sp. TaxID=1005933 RepID=UPI002AAABCF7|nr:bacteriohemerythrin [uncultured Methanoregula sp.]
MPLMTWNDELSVKVTEIDDQHKKLIGLINNLHDAMKVGQGKQVLESTLQELASYTVYHFQTEEKYMQKFSYPGYPAHKMKHDAFVKKISDFQKDYHAGRLGISLDLMNFLKEWVTTHIRDTDRQYSDTFVKAGLR